MSDCECGKCRLECLDCGPSICNVDDHVSDDMKYGRAHEQAAVSHMVNCNGNGQQHKRVTEISLIASPETNNEPVFSVTQEQIDCLVDDRAVVHWGNVWPDYIQQGAKSKSKNKK